MSPDKQKYDYLVIPRMRVQHANALATYWLVSPVVIVPARQMMHALSRHLELVDFEAGVSVIHHDYALESDHIGRQYQPHQHVSAVGLNPSDYISGLSLPIQPTIKQSLTVTLVMRFKKGAPIDLDEVHTFLAHGRFAGGTITDYLPIIYSEKLSDVRRTIKTGFLQYARYDMLYRADASGIDTLLDVMGGDVAVNEDGEPDSWVMPAMVGYQAISEVKEREGGRNGYPGAFVEPLVGYIQMRSINQVPPGDPIPFWDYNVTEARFCVTEQ